MIKIQKKIKNQNQKKTQLTYNLLQNTTYTYNNSLVHNLIIHTYKCELVANYEFFKVNSHYFILECFWYSRMPIFFVSMGKFPHVLK